MSKPSLRRVVVGVDFGQSSIRAARWSARSLGPEIELVLVHCLAINDAPPFLAPDAPTREERVETAAGRARARLERLAASLPMGGVRTEVRDGRAPEELARAVEAVEADLVVVGEHGRRAGHRGSLGSASAQLPAVCLAPILVKRHLPERRPLRILAAVDHSGHADIVLGWARYLAERQRSQGELVVHFSLDPPTDDDRHNMELAREWLAAKAAAAGLPDASIDVSTGDPRYEILAVQRRQVIDLLVVGRRGVGSAAPPLVGSVGSAILQSAFCSVLLV